MGWGVKGMDAAIVRENQRQGVRHGEKECYSAMERTERRTTEGGGPQRGVGSDDNKEEINLRHFIIAPIETPQREIVNLQTRSLPNTRTPPRH